MNLLPGHGLGYSASRDLAFGLGPVSMTIVEPPAEPFYSGGGGGGGNSYSGTYHVIDNEYALQNDDDEVMEILSIIFQVIE